MVFEIRDLRDADLDSVRSLVRQFQEHLVTGDPTGAMHAFKSAGDVAAYVDQLRRDVSERDGAFLVALNENGEIVGCTVGVIDRHDGDVLHNLTHYPSVNGWIGLIAVDYQRRREGVGRALVGALRERFRAAQCDSMRLLVHAHNSVAVEFYRELGLEPFEVQMTVKL